ncbi:metallopeptidase MepB [Amylocarpus encephaloides]|uniref:Metallopeptidase MepB n=1 Tax=Amylocarpus encephaloides TaxID=45428 RepID=A0A9P7YKZ1_9HELO|nr:metallopeptidase MepB [Amylocarpus encephaloides]
MPSSIFPTPPQLPVAFTHCPESLLWITQEAIASSKKKFDHIALQSSATPTFAQGVLPLAFEENKLTNQGSLTGFYKYVAYSRELRDASIVADRLWIAYAREVTLREDLFKIVDGVYRKRRKSENLDFESQHYLSKKHAGLLRNGLGIRHQQSRKCFELLQNRIDHLSLQCSRNIREDCSGLWFTADELEGLSREALCRLRQGSKGTLNEGKYWLSFGTVNLNFALTYISNPDTRRRMYIGSESRCQKNIPMVEEITCLRAEAASLLGYENHIDFMTQDRMMTSKDIEVFLSDLQKQIYSRGEIDMARMRLLKRADLEARGLHPRKIDDRLYLWDDRYFSRLLKESRHYVNEALMAEYFPLEPTLKGLLALVKELFGIVFNEISPEFGGVLMEEAGQAPEALTWHEDVKVYAVYNEEVMGGNFLGYFYIDLLRREGKCDHPCNVTFQAGFDLPDGTRHYPSTALLTSFPPPTPYKPTLLRYHQLISLFHELGHGIHYLLGRTKYATTYGTSTSKDFVEIPSKMLENWCWDPSILSRLSCHYSHLSPEYHRSWRAEHPYLRDTEERAPWELLEKFVATRTCNLALTMQRQLHLSIFDRAIHHLGVSDLRKLKFGSLYNKIRKNVTGLLGPESERNGNYDWGCGHARFDHLFIGYDAGYYCYSVASVYATDIFETKFKRNPLDPEEGRRYRRLILEKGGSKPEMELLEEYLGRPPNGEAFSRALRC